MAPEVSADTTEHGSRAPATRVAFIARGAHLEAIRQRGLQVYSPLGDMHLPEPVATDDPADIGPSISCWWR